MFTLRKGAIVSLGMFAGVGMNAAHACDNDRFPCPVASEAVTQETAAAAEPVQVAPQPKKASQSARPATKPQPKSEQSLPRAKSREVAPPARTTGNKTAVPKQQAAPIPKNDLASETAISASTIVQPPGSDEPPKEANQAVVAAAGAAWPTLPTADSARVTTAAPAEEAQSETDHANAVQASNGSDLAGKWPMLSYLSMIVSGVLALMSALWLLPRMRVRAKPAVADEEELGASPYTSN